MVLWGALTLKMLAVRLWCPCLILASKWYFEKDEKEDNAKSQHN